MPGVLFLCVANSARSQLAEAIARDLDDRVEAWSAGFAPTRVRPQVRPVLNEVGIDAHGLRSKGLQAVPLNDIDLIITLCREAQCSVIPHGIPVRAWPLPDPASVMGDEEDKREAFRATRDELQRRMPALLAELAGSPRP